MFLMRSLQARGDVMIINNPVLPNSGESREASLNLTLTANVKKNNNGRRKSDQLQKNRHHIFFCFTSKRT